MCEKTQLAAVRYLWYLQSSQEVKLCAISGITLIQFVHHIIIVFPSLYHFFIPMLFNCYFMISAITLIYELCQFLSMIIRLL